MFFEDITLSKHEGEVWCFPTIVLYDTVQDSMCQNNLYEIV